MEPLKEMFNKNYYETLGQEFHKADKNFHPEKFIAAATKNLSSLELNQRLRQTSEVLKVHLHHDYKKALQTMREVIPHLKRDYTALVFPDFVGLYGKEHFDLSLDALKYFTRFGSSEFAIREILRKDFDKTIKVMQGWANDKDRHVRRLASEGSRPRLPWSFKLERVIKDPKTTLRILETLKEDEELYVKKSVANHLNDVSKDHPDFLLNIIGTWKGRSAHTDWILKHAGRTLLKKGHPKALAHFGIKHHPSLEVSSFKLLNKTVKEGENVGFAFQLKNKGLKQIKVRIEYAVYFRIASGGLSKKVFKVSEKEAKAKSTLIFEKKHSFRKISTRKYNKGLHRLSLVINGRESALLDFVLK